MNLIYTYVINLVYCVVDCLEASDFAYAFIEEMPLPMTMLLKVHRFVSLPTFSLLYPSPCLPTMVSSLVFSVPTLEFTSLIRMVSYFSVEFSSMDLNLSQNYDYLCSSGMSQATSIIIIIHNQNVAISLLTLISYALIVSNKLYLL